MYLSLNVFFLEITLCQSACHVHLRQRLARLPYLPVLLQSDGAVVVCVMHVEQDWKRKQEFNSWSDF